MCSWLLISKATFGLFCRIMMCVELGGGEGDCLPLAGLLQLGQFDLSINAMATFVDQIDVQSWAGHVVVENLRND